MTDSPSTTGRQQRNTPVNNNNNSRHINFIWPKLSEVTYERHFPGQSVQVAGPTETDPVVTIESSLLLKTASLEQVLPLYKKCSQYEHKGGCEKGPLCKYIHAVHIDTTLEKRKRFRRTTPNPGRLGELSVMTTTDLSATCCSTGGDCDFETSPHAPPPPAILTLPTPSVPQKGAWWYRDPYSQRRIHIAAPPSTFEAFTSSVTYIP